MNTYRLDQLDCRIMCATGETPFEPVLRGVADFQEVALDVIERLVEELEKVETTEDMSDADEWRAKYALWLAVQLCWKHGKFTQLDVFNQMVDDGLLEPPYKRWHPWEIAYVRRGPFTHVHGTANDLAFHRDGIGKPLDYLTAAYPHPGPPP